MISDISDMDLPFLGHFIESFRIAFLEGNNSFRAKEFINLSRDIHRSIIFLSSRWFLGCSSNRLSGVVFLKARQRCRGFSAMSGLMYLIEIIWWGVNILKEMCFVGFFKSIEILSTRSCIDIPPLRGCRCFGGIISDTSIDEEIVVR